MWKADVSEAIHAGDDFNKSLTKLPSTMQNIVHQTGAVHAKRTHKYRNRTYNLERSTDAYLTKSSPSNVTVTLTPTAEYAICVARSGHLDMDESAKVAELALDFFFSAFSE